MRADTFLTGRGLTGSVLQRAARLCALSLPLLASLLGGVASAEVLHEERSVYRNIIVTEVDDRRCLISTRCVASVTRPA